MPINDFAELLRMVTADSKDDGKEFTVRDRLAVIGQLLAGSNYRPVVSEPLALVYAQFEPGEGDNVLLVSSHVDCVYGKCFCSDEGDLFRGTFDNSFGNAAVLWCMLNGTLPANVVVAFTGDEEKDSNGAVQALLALGRMGCCVTSVIVQDVTNVGWDSGALFTIENDSGFDLMTAYSIIASLEQYDGRFAFSHDAEPDEAWTYAEYGLPVLTLCAPVKGELHNDAGVLLRKESALEYCNVLSLLANVLR